MEQLAQQLHARALLDDTEQVWSVRWVCAHLQVDVVALRRLAQGPRRRDGAATTAVKKGERS